MQFHIGTLMVTGGCCSLSDIVINAQTDLTERAVEARIKGPFIIIVAVYHSVLYHPSIQKFHGIFAGITEPFNDQQ